CHAEAKSEGGLPLRIPNAPPGRRIPACRSAGVPAHGRVHVRTVSNCLPVSANGVKSVMTQRNLRCCSPFFTTKLWPSLSLSLLQLRGAFASAQLPKPTDAPLPRSPEETVAAFKLPEGFRLEVIASEPLIASPSAVCWDERGRMFVSELHGYNLE